MVRVDHLTAQPIVRALLWPLPALVPLLDEARRAGHVSKISELDQYHQFTLAEPGTERMSRLLGDLPIAPSGMPVAREPTGTCDKSNDNPSAPVSKRQAKPKKGRKKETASEREHVGDKPKQLSLLRREQ